MVGRLFSEERCRRLALWSHRRSLTIVTGAVILCGLSLSVASRLQLDSNLIALLPSDNRNVEELRRAIAKSGGFGELMVMVESPRPEEAVRFAEALLPEVRALPWVEHAEIGRDTAFFDERRLLYLTLDDLETIRNRLDARVRYEKSIRNPLYIDLEDTLPPSLDFSDLKSRYQGLSERRPRYTTEDGRVLIMVVRPRGVTADLAFARRIHREIDGLIAARLPDTRDPQLRVSTGGTFKNWIDEYDTVVGDVGTSAGWVGLAIIGLLVVYFRRPSAVLLLCLPLLISLSWTFALAQLAIGTLNLITVFLVVILFGLGIDFGIHMLARYWSERERVDPITALATTIRHAGRASLTACLTTASAFFLLTLMEFRGFSEFGFIAGTGLLFSAIAFLVVFPAMLALSERVRSARRLPSRWLKSVHGPIRRPGWILAGCLVVTAGMGIGLPRLAFEYDLRQLRSDAPTTRAFTGKMRRVFEQGRGAALILVDRDEEAKQVARAVRERRAVRGENSAIQQVWTLPDLIPPNQEAKRAIIADLRTTLNRHWDELPEKERTELADVRAELDVQPFGAEDLPAPIRRRFTGLPGTPGQLVWLFHVHGLLDLRRAQAFAQEVRDIRVGDKRYHPTNEPLVFASIFDVLKRDAPIALALTLIAVFIAVWLDVRRIGHTLLVLTPLLLGILWMLSAMGTATIKLNLLNAVIFPSLLGIGVDAGVHLFHRYQEIGARDLHAVLRKTGATVAMCSATSMISFGSLLFADHPGLRSIGTVAIVGLGVCLIASLVFFPALLAWLRPERHQAAIPAVQRVDGHFEGQRDHHILH